jgi:uncharacterized membrane protein YdjX (TVP38/TMEM64 family)
MRQPADGEGEPPASEFAEHAETEQAVAKLPRTRAAWILRGVLVALFLSAPALAMRVPVVQQFVVSLAHGLRDGGPRGIAIYWAICALSGGIAAPVIIFAGIAGFAFGPVGGVLVALPGIALHACSAFLIGRTFLRARVEEKLAGNARWAGIEGALRAEGFRIAVLLRLTPILPQNLLSYALSASSISFARFALATVLGLAPIVVVQATLGSLVENAAQLLSDGGDMTRELLVLAGSAVVSLLALYAVTRVASRALGRAMERHDHARPPS